MGLRDSIECNFTRHRNDDSEFAVCWDLGIVDRSLLTDNKIKVAYYLQYSRAAVHFVSYINKLGLLKEGTYEVFLDITTSLYNALICMAIISGLSSEEIPLKKFFEVVKKSNEQVSSTDLTVFMWHNIITGEAALPWFGLNENVNSDWQSVRDTSVILFSLLSSLCYSLNIDFETLCSHFVKKPQKY